MKSRLIKPPSGNINEIEEYFFTTDRGEIYERVIEYVDRLLIEKALEHSAGNQLQAAKILGINRNTLRAKIKKLHIEVLKFKGPALIVN